MGVAAIGIPMITPVGGVGYIHLCEVLVNLFWFFVKE
jgi:hypothetical protein